MRFTDYSFGSIRVDGVTYDHDLIIDCGKIRKRKKAASRKFRGASGHTPLSIAENIPWRCRRLVVGTGQGPGEYQRRLAPDLLNLPGVAQAIHLSGCVRFRPIRLVTIGCRVNDQAYTDRKAVTGADTERSATDVPP